MAPQPKTFPRLFYVLRQVRMHDHLNMLCTSILINCTLNKPQSTSVISANYLKINSFRIHLDVVITYIYGAFKHAFHLSFYWLTTNGAKRPSLITACALTKRSDNVLLPYIAILGTLKNESYFLIYLELLEMIRCHATSGPPRLGLGLYLCWDHPSTRGNKVERWKIT